MKSIYTIITKSLTFLSSRGQKYQQNCHQIIYSCYSHPQFSCKHQWKQTYSWEFTRSKQLLGHIRSRLASTLDSDSRLQKTDV